MRYDATLRLADGRSLRIRSAEEADAKNVCDFFARTHEQTDYLLAYPEENSFTIEQEGAFLQRLLESDREVMLLSEVDGVLCGCASVCAVGVKYKIRHRAEFGISVDKSFWGLGIGTKLTQAAIDCAKTAGYRQLELDVVVDNNRALRMYEHAGFQEFGRNPMGFQSKASGDQTLVYMRLEL